MLDCGWHSLHGGAVLNLAGDERANFVADSSAHVKEGFVRGEPSIVFDGSNTTGGCSFGDADKFDGYSACTWQIIFNQTNNSPKIFSKWGTSNSWLIQLANAGDNLVWIAAEDSGGNRRRWDGTGLFANSKTWNLVLSWRGGAEKSCWVNGVDKTSVLTVNSAVATAQRSGTAVCQIGIAADGTPMLGGVMLARMWNRGLSDGECDAISRNPYRIYSGTQNHWWHG